jgi:hypothetical protein
MTGESKTSVKLKLILLIVGCYSNWVYASDIRKVTSYKDLILARDAVETALNSGWRRPAFKKDLEVAIANYLDAWEFLPNECLKDTTNVPYDFAIRAAVWLPDEVCGGLEQRAKEIYYKTCRLHD